MKTCLIICIFLLVIAGHGGLLQHEPGLYQPVAIASADAAKAEVTDPVTGMEFVFVKGGCFKMGDTFSVGEKDERPVHEVCVSDYYLGKYEVTQSQWKLVMGNNPSANKACGPDCPVEYVSWNAVQEYLRQLNGKSGIQYRLPTEAEWEYAARSGGKEEKWAGTNDEASLGEFAWYDKNSDTVMHPVGQKKPNGLGLHDMTGNVLEWCHDWYSENYYEKSPKNNPSGPASGEKRVMRGGYVDDFRAGKRNQDDPDAEDGSNGFRLLRPVR